jgi:hypothetical protein
MLHSSVRIYIIKCHVSNVRNNYISFVTSVATVVSPGQLAVAVCEGAHSWLIDLRFEVIFWYDELFYFLAMWQRNTTQMSIWILP